MSSSPPPPSSPPTQTPTSIPTPHLAFGATEPHSTPTTNNTTTTSSASTQTPAVATPAATSGATSSLKAVQRDRQARNKSPKTGEAVWCGEEGGTGGEGEGDGVREEKVSYTDDSYEAVERRRWAATILDCPELLMMHAQARQDTIPSTRLHFTKLLCGYEDTPRKTKKAKAKRSGRGVKE
ncbi:hypothetical protein VE01_06299 [Pseudogymnoascus verrucosus]|uniref:Uncharacterized protein n=1 Tax=Pseudogymnoascus verrucosus TaxID=342668 RepID=A0A1B8GGC4_9PEZI|nr:uncharacterized protein VE01_06299 [Pseudogymnoascus verrucosus]OBT94875.1 hypothetical protein VE01_06299 [Pseudogymnoascus verrucosus]